MRRFIAAAVAGMLFAGCTPALSAPSHSASVDASTQLQATSEPADTAERASGLALTDGRPMLWPITSSIFDEKTYATKWRVGFVTATGQRIPSDYLSYDYCLGSDGFPARVVASTPSSLQVLALTGEKTAEIPVSNPYFVNCVANRFIAAYNVEWTTELDDTTAAFDLDAGDWLSLPSFLVGKKVVLMESTLLDYLGALIEPGRPFCMNDDGDGPHTPNRFRDINGKVLDDKLDCSPFVGDYAEATLDEQNVIVDRSLRVVADDDVPWTLSNAWGGTVRYAVYENNGYTFLNLDREVIGHVDMDLDPDAEPDAAGWSNTTFVRLDETGATLVDSASATTRRLEGFTKWEGHYLLSSDNTRAYALHTGAEFALPACTEGWVGPDLLTCRDMDSAVNFWPSGAPAQAHTWPQDFYSGPLIPSGIIMFVKLTRYQGFVDANGDWLYKEGVYQDLED
jgi:hypothetical protein